MSRNTPPRHPGHGAENHHHDAAEPGGLGDPRAADCKQRQPQRIGGQQCAQRDFAKTHDQQRQQGRREYRPQIAGIGHPEHRIAVDQQVAQGAAADGRHRGDDQHAEPVQMLAPGGQHAADREHRNAEKIHQLQRRDGKCQRQIHRQLQAGMCFRRASATRPCGN
jgi:hypothetical protein